MKEKKSQTIVACSDANDPCPVAEITESEVTIRDDFGGVVRMTRKQFSVLVEKASKIESE